jgi:uncharacterized protein YeaO (DUF488 family)
MFRIKRVYAPPAREDGFRVLVDRLWPRGLSKEAAAVDEWLRDIAPSTALRKWFHQDTDRWAEFARRYRAELHSAEPAATLERLRALGRDYETVTLLFGAREERRNHASLLHEILTSEK